MPAVADFQESFESGEVTWRLADADAGYRLVSHQRVSQGAHTGQGCEYLQVAATAGTFIHLTCEIPRSRVIAELNSRLWVKSDRSGLQFMARLVLPRTADPRTGSPITALLRGDIYNRVGSWQQLSIPQIDQLLDRQVRVLRSQFGSEIDAREAFVDLVVLNIYGGIGVTNVWIDDLEISGQVPQAAFTTQSVPPGEVAGPQARPDDNVVGKLQRSREPVRLQGTVLVASGRPLFVRAVEYNAEPLEWLKSLGINAVKLKAPATAVQLQEANRLGLWLIAPAPNELVITPAYEAVLAWDLGSRLKEDRLEVTRQWSGQVRRADPLPDRPLLCGAEERLWGYSRFANLLLVPPPPLGGGVSPTDCGATVRQRPALARPGTPLWAAIPTEPDPALVEQWSAFGLESPLSMSVEPEQIGLLAYHALASGARGLVFTSRSPLDRQDADTILRARALKRLNLELEFLEPWAAGGASSADIESGETNFRIGTLQTERAQLLIILSQTSGQQFTVGPVADKTLSLVVPSMVNSPHVYRITAAGLRTLSHRRVPGGIRIALEEPGLVSLVAITQDPLVINHLGRVLTTNKAELAKLGHEVASGELQLVEQIHARLAGDGQEPRAVSDWLAQARSNLRHCELLLGASDYSAASAYAERAVDSLSRVRRYHWQQAVQSFPSPVSSPFCVSFPALPLHWQMAQRLQTASPWEPNALPAGDFENLEHLRATGWQNDSLSSGPVRTLVEVAQQTPHGGQSALRLVAWAAEPQTPVPVVETPPIRIRSGPVRVRSGQLVSLRGWVRVPQRISGSPDGLLVYDSVSGPALAERISVTEGWREFVLYRAVPYGGDLSLVIALTGLGEAWLDDVTISLHEPLANRSSQEPLDQARRLPPVSDRLR